MKNYKIVEKWKKNISFEETTYAQLYMVKRVIFLFFFYNTKKYEEKQSLNITPLCFFTQYSTVS